MQTDPVMEWRRLTEHYRALGEEELRALALDFSDLTEMAQQALRTELRSRGLGDPESLPDAPPAEAREPVSFRPQPANAFAPHTTGVLGRQAAGVFGPNSETPQLVPDDPEPGNEDEGPHEYTWKTVLCACDTREQAWQLAEALRRAGIESWIKFQGYIYSNVPLTQSQYGTGGLEILVAADQLEQARAILAQPIPQDIVDESHQTPPDFVAPTCPGCGAQDPVLLSADPVNAWRCEVCGREWVDGVPAAQEEPKKGSFGIPGATNGKSRPATGQLYPQGE
jgi:hypothetical protein